MSTLRIGCSGWAYRDWPGKFYPPEVKAKDRLAWYAERFDTAEINASFYRLPGEALVASWAKAAPPGFVFAWKASRTITHYRRLVDCEESVKLVFDRMEGLGEAFGPVLFQLPPSFKRDDDLLAAFAALLPKGRRCAFEFRHVSWYEPAVYDLMRSLNLAFVIHDHHQAPSPVEVTADFVYWRGHGPTGRYFGHYSRERLEALADDIAGWQASGRDVYAYFDNTMGAAAPEDIAVLEAMLEGGKVPSAAP